MSLKIKVVDMQKQEKDRSIMIVVIGALVIIECFALAMGYNGQIQRVVMAVIALGTGLMTPTPQIKELIKRLVK